MGRITWFIIRSTSVSSHNLVSGNRRSRNLGVEVRNSQPVFCRAHSSVVQRCFPSLSRGRSFRLSATIFSAPRTPPRLRTSSSGVGFNVSKCAKILLGHCPGRDAVTVLDYLIGALYGLQKAIELEFVDRPGVRHSAYHPRLPQYVGALQKSEPLPQRASVGGIPLTLFRYIFRYSRFL